MSEHSIKIKAGKKKRLQTAGKYCDRDIVVEAEGTPTQEKSIEICANGTHIIEPEPNHLLSRVKATVNVPEKQLFLDIDFLPNLDFPDLGDIEIETEYIYRLTEGLYVNMPIAKIKQDCTTYIVDELPEVGEPCTLDGVNINAIYYNSTDEVLYAYVSAEIAPVLGVDADWYDAGTLLQALGFSYGGVVTSFESMVEEDTFYFIARPSCFMIQDDAWVEVFIGTHECSGGGGSDEPSKLALVLATQDASNPYEITQEDVGSITEVPQYFFHSKIGLTKFDVPSVTKLGDYAFYGCSYLATINTPYVYSIGSYCFQNCKSKEEFEFLEATTIGQRAFSGCTEMKSINIKKATSIGSYAFNSCTLLENVNMENVKTIDSYAFQHCYNISILAIPATCTSIGNNSFANVGKNTANGKTTYKFLGETPPTIYANSFNKDYIDKIIVPMGYGNTYKAATNWANLADYIVEATE